MENLEQTKWLLKANELIKQFYSISNDYQVAIDSAIFMASYFYKNSSNLREMSIDDDEFECNNDFWRIVTSELKEIKKTLQK